MRPAFAPNPTGACVSPLAACHYYGPRTAPYTPIPINYLTGPDQFTLNLRLSKTFGFGPEIHGNTGQQAGSPGGHSPTAHAGGGGGGRRRRLRVEEVRWWNVRRRRGNQSPLQPDAERQCAECVLNNVNPGIPIGVITSTNFGRSVGLAGGPFSTAAANRKIELQAAFSF